MLEKNYIKKAFLVIIVVLLGVLVVGNMGSQKIYSSDTTFAQLERFNEVFYYVNRYYVEAPDKEKLITGAVNGMLSELDPHSVYIPKKELERVNEQFEGSFEGIGIEFIVLNKVLTVVSPIVGGPSEAVGLLPGDQIVRIEDESAYGITENEVQKKLRGPKGSKVKLTIRRPSMSENFEVVITRDTIPIYSVISSFIMDDGETGYVLIGRFARTTSEELDKALDDLQQQGMKKLVLDLRGNSGGYLEQAFEVADKFLPGGYKIVYTRGRKKSMGSDLISTDRSTRPLNPLIIMIDHGSASASEIVAGAIQDLDRGLVVGQTSFGKGLVQNQIPLKDGSALRLTIARYYTPSGRLIQRDYDGGLMDYYQEAYEDESSKHPDSTKVYKTLSGRTVYGGGGITPDSILSDIRITRLTNRMISKRIFFEYGSNYASAHKNEKLDFNMYRANFQVTEPMLEDFKEIIKKHNIEFSQEAFDKDIDFVKMLIKAEIARNLYSSNHYYQIRISADSEVKQALGLFPKATEICKLHAWDGYSENSQKKRY